MAENINYNQYLTDNPVITSKTKKNAFKTVAMYVGMNDFNNIENDSTNSRNDRWCELINKIKSKINAFRWYLNNQQSGYIAKAVRHELTEWHQVVTAKNPGDITHELLEEFQNEGGINDWMC